MRNHLLECFQQTLDAIHGQHCVYKALQNHAIVKEKCTVVAIGKAAQAMAQGADKALGEKLEKGLLISKHQHIDVSQLSSRWQCYEAAHPVPDHSSLAAGKQLLDFLNNNKEFPLLFLLSGGTSSLVEVLVEDVTLQQWQKLNEWLLASGLDIGAVNTIRKRVSAIKGGKLLHYLTGREIHALLISDVPGDHPHIIGSGLLFSSTQKAETINNLDFPSWLIELIENSAFSSEVTGSKNLHAELLSHQVVASNRQAVEVAAQVASSQGYQVYIHDEFLQGDAQQAGSRLAHFLRDGAEPGVHIWGGETTMTLPAKPGRGGRNQHLALSAACVLAGNEQICLLAAGTDGSDGPTEDAGAFADAGTIGRGLLAGLDAYESLARADSGTFLEAAGDLLYTGPTGTNVMDLVIAIKNA